MSKAPQNANVLTSHVLYKVKKGDDGALTLKACIAIHGNKDREKHLLKTDSATCPPVGIRILLSLAVFFKWTLAKIDFKSAYLQTEASRDVFVIPPRECSTRYCHYWLLLSAAYGLINAGAKWQQLSDEVLRSFGFLQVVYVPQLFYLVESGRICILALNLVDDILFAGQRKKVSALIKKIGEQYQLGIIVYGPGRFKFYGLRVEQTEDATISIDGEEKLQAFDGYVLSWPRRKELDQALSAIEASAFRSLNCSIGWLGIAASPFCAHAASYLQQRGPSPLVKDLFTQVNLLKLLKRRGSVLKFARPNGEMQCRIFVFCDASHSTDHGQLGFVAGMLFGDLSLDSVFHTISWSSHKSRRPVKSIGSAEILAAGEAINEGKVLARAYTKLLGFEIGLWVVVDSKDLYGTLSTCRNASDRLIRGDVSVIRFDFETKKIERMVWVPGKCH